MKPVEHYTGREQTYLKHRFLEQYLETVAYHIGYSNDEFVYVDCFSGPWRAEDEEYSDTSIRIALAKLNAVRAGLAQRGKYPRIRAIFVERSPTAFLALERVLAEHRGGIGTTAIRGEFEENIDRIVKETGTAFTFFFVDPTGWTGFAMENLRPILRRSKGEIVVNFMYDHINRFLSFRNAANERSLDLCFGTGDWRLVPGGQEREEALVALYVDQLRKTGRFEYASHIRILKPIDERTYFHLVYATRNPKGIVKFRDVEKQVAHEQESVRGKKQREHREERSGQNELLFETDTPSGGFRGDRAQQLGKAMDLAMSLLGNGPLPFEVLLPRILELRLMWKSDLDDLFLRGDKASRFAIEGLRPRERTLKPNCVVRLSRP